MIGCGLTHRRPFLLWTTRASGRTPSLEIGTREDTLLPLPNSESLPCCLVIRAGQSFHWRPFAGSGPINQIPKPRAVGKNQSLKIRIFVNRDKQSSALAVLRHHHRSGLRQCFDHFTKVILDFSQTLDLHSSNSSPSMNSLLLRF